MTDPDLIEFASDPVVSEVVTPENNLAGKVPRTANQILQWMKSRQEYYGSPLPDGYVPPPGIDIQELLKKLPPPRPRPDAPPPA